MNRIFIPVRLLKLVLFTGYGDSSQVEPSEEGVVADTKAVYRWVKSKARGSKIFFWGHSLGTGYLFFPYFKFRFKLNIC
jgi:hypothetical protein